MHENIPNTNTKLTGREIRTSDKAGCEVMDCNQQTEKIYEVNVTRPRGDPHGEQFNVSLCNIHFKRFAELNWEWYPEMNGGLDPRKTHLAYRVHEKK